MTYLPFIFSWEKKTQEGSDTNRIDFQIQTHSYIRFRIQRPINSLIYPFPVVSVSCLLSIPFVLLLIRPCLSKVLNPRHLAPKAPPSLFSTNHHLPPRLNQFGWMKKHPISYTVYSIKVECVSARDQNIWTWTKQKQRKTPFVHGKPPGIEEHTLLFKCRILLVVNVSAPSRSLFGVENMNHKNIYIYYFLFETRTKQYTCIQVLYNCERKEFF